MQRRIIVRLGLGVMLGIATAGASATGPAQLDDKGQRAYEAYQQAGRHKAFAIAPGGVWSWRAESADEATAKRAAQSDCEARTSQDCQIYDLNNRVVFDQARWASAWGPYLDRRKAQAAPVGLGLGQRFPDLLFSDGRGRAIQLSKLRGRVVVLHFWGSWCPHCVREMPEIQRLYGRLARSREVSFVLLPVRESHDRARRWLEARKLSLPLYDGGPSVIDKRQFRLAGGGRLSDRDLARVFPSTYILDKQGVVIFSHSGPLAGWSEYEALLRDAARRSGK